MDVGRTTTRAGARNSVVAGSVWETRMKSDEVKGGIKVFKGEDTTEEPGGDAGGGSACGDGGVVVGGGDAGGGSACGDGGVVVGGAPPINRKLKTAQTGRRKTWKTESVDVISKSPIQLSKGRSDTHKNFEEQCKELCVSVDGGGVKRSPIQVRKTRSEASKELTRSFDGSDRSPIHQLKKPRSESRKGSEVGENGDGIGRNSVPLKKAKPESSKVIDKSGKSGVEEIEKIPIDQSRKAKSSKGIAETVEETTETPMQVVKAKAEVTDVSVEKIVDVGCDDGIEKSPIQVNRTRSDETVKEFGVCQEKVITSSLTNAGHQIKSAPKMLEIDDGVVDDDDDDDDQEDEELEEYEEMEDEEFEIEIEKKSIDIKEINVPEQKPNKVVIVDKKLHQFHQKPVPISPIVNKQPPPVVKRATIYQNLNIPTSNFTKPTPNLTKPTPVRNSYEFQRVPRTQNRLQSLVDLTMWRDVSRSAFVFGIGTFIILSSSYTKDLNISFISVISYLGLVYLALIFLYRTILSRGAIDVDEPREEYVVGEEEATWILKLLLPYINEFLLNLRALFSGDPATTMKLAVVLFVLARCGSSITIWKMAKLGFFGVFTVPKVCSSYSAQLTGYGKFWVQRFRDAWESCTHKKAVAAAIFTLVWNLSSIIARIWALFMLFVAFRCYQQSMVGDDWAEDEAGGEDTCQSQVGGERQGRGPTLVELRKEKKVS